MVTELTQIVLRSFIALVTLLIFARLIGKQQISQLNFFDYITGITVGSIAASLSTDLSARPLSLWAGLLSWMAIILFLDFVIMKNRKLHKILDGEPTVVIQNGKILEQNLGKLQLPVDTLVSQLRSKDIFDLNQVEFALLESDGKLAVLKKSQYQPVTPNDLQLSTEYQGVPTELIIEGKVIYGNLDQINKDITWLQQELNKQGINNMEQVFYATLSSNGQLFVDKYGDDLFSGTVTDVSDYPGPG